MIGFDTLSAESPEATGLVILETYLPSAQLTFPAHAPSSSPHVLFTLQMEGKRLCSIKIFIDT